MSQKRKVRLLHIEDDEGQVLLSREILEREGYLVETSLTGKQGLALAQSGSFDVFLIDQKLPDMTGLDLYDQLRSIAPDSVCIMVTGSGDEKIAIRAMKAGMTDYIVKATNAAHLEALPVVIEGALQHQALQKEKEQYAANLERRVAERTRELEEKNRTLQRYQRLTEGRELDMRRLKDEVNELLGKLGAPKKY